MFIPFVCLFVRPFVRSLVLLLLLLFFPLCLRFFPRVLSISRKETNASVTTRRRIVLLSPLPRRRANRKTDAAWTRGRIVERRWTTFTTMKSHDAGLPWDGVDDIHNEYIAILSSDDTRDFFHLTSLLYTLYSFLFLSLFFFFVSFLPLFTYPYHRIYIYIFKHPCFSSVQTRFNEVSV